MTEKIDGITVEIIKKDVRRINIRVYPDGNVKVSVPLFMNRSEILNILDERLEWIKRTQKRLFENQKAENLISEENSKKIVLFGEPYELVFSSSAPFGVSKKDKTVLVSLPSSSDESRKKALDGFLEQQLEQVLTVLVSKWEQITQLYCSEWKIKNVKSYWGKCKLSTKSLTFNLKLVHQTSKDIEYVVLHEIAHLKYPDHQKDFKLFLSKYMPDWSYRAAHLKSP